MKASFALGFLGLTVAISPALANPHVDANGILIRDANSCGTTRTPSPVGGVSTPFAAPIVRTIFLNKNGGTYNVTNGATNAATNTANTIASGDGGTHSNAIIPAIESSFDWPYIVTCVKKHYKPYNVIVTETEPTSGNYVEAVVGGTGSSTGWSPQSGILGVASADNFCGVTEKGIAFSFSTNHLGIQQKNDELCATIAHEVGHLLSLEHEIAGPDTMSYVPFASSGAKSFTTTNSQCGTDSQNTSGCSCQTTGAGQVTNSGMRLTQFLGLRPIETTPPTLDVASPGNNKTLPPTFNVIANATDNVEMDQVAVLLNGTMMASSSMASGSTYTIPVTGVAEGAYTMQVQAIDLAGNVTTKDLMITVARAATGDNCTANDDCHGNICAVNSDGSHFCTEACTAAMNTCPSDFDCSAVGTQNVCIPSSGGCSIGGGGPKTMLMVLGVLLVLMRRRRR